MQRTVLMPILVVATLSLLASSRADNSKRPLTVKDAIEAAQFVYPYGADPVYISADGKRYLVVLERGDIARNGSWVEVLSGNTASLARARNISVAARLFTKSTASAGDLIKDVRWLDDSRQVAFLWDGGRQPRNVISVDLANHKIVTLAQYVTPIADYDISRDGRTIVFTAEGRHDSSREGSLERAGFAVIGQSLSSLLAGNFDGWTPRRHFDTFVLSRSTGTLSPVREPEATWFTTPELLRLSPDGRYAITIRPSPAVPAQWNGYTDHLFKDIYLPAARENPDAPNLIRQYFVVDVSKRTARPLWNAPENPGARVVWSPDGKTLVIGPTFCPLPTQNIAGETGRAVVEVNVETGRYQFLPVPQAAEAPLYYPTRWSDNALLQLSAGESSSSQKLYFQKIDGRWMATEAPRVAEEQVSNVRIELRQDLNTPPVLYAVDPRTQAETVVEDPNPQLRELSLAQVESVHWKAADGRSWTGALYYPIHYQKGRKFPLVIQTHGYSRDRYLLDGAFTTVFAAQALANRDIAVLQVGGPDEGTADFVATPKEPRVYTAGFEAAIDALVARGLVDRGRVGIIGFSRTGWYVEYMLTHSDAKLAAAEVADNIDASYVQYVLADSIARSEIDADNGARPEGAGLERWMDVAPGFNTSKIHTPLRLEIDTGPVSSILYAWEIFSNLRYLRRPVELFVIPDIQHGVHILQNPAQRLASQGGTVDWFCFWLKNEVDADPAKRPEYDRWRKMKLLAGK